MLDTDTCIFARKRPAAFKPRLPLHECGISIIVLGELELGVAQSDRVEENRAALRSLLDAVRVVDVDAEVAREYGQLRAYLRSIGLPIGPNDLWIAAHALALDVPLVTHNLSEFRRVPGLASESWLTGAA
jgi:tRNA(fMet)-specific endonuclease VapC